MAAVSSSAAIMGFCAFDAEGNPLWSRSLPNAYAVNISGDGRLVVAALGDSTIRWYRMDDGGELLALQVLSDRKTGWRGHPKAITALPPGPSGC